MTNRPIIFSAPMVLALLAGRKTMTRRLAWSFFDVNDNHTKKPTPWQRVQPGDRLWVREGWKPHSLYDAMKPRDMPKAKIFYLADESFTPSGSRGRPSIHMPRAFSRLRMDGSRGAFDSSCPSTQAEHRRAREGGGVMTRDWLFLGCQAGVEGAK